MSVDGDGRATRVPTDRVGGDVDKGGVTGGGIAGDGGDRQSDPSERTQSDLALLTRAASGATSTIFSPTGVGPAESNPESASGRGRRPFSTSFSCPVVSWREVTRPTEPSAISKSAPA